MKREIVVATCQFPVSANIQKNESFIFKQLRESKTRGAEICHFSESSLSGYAGIDFMGLINRDESLLHLSLARICEESSKLNIWSIVGGHQYQEKNNKPYNCLWIIDGNGKIVSRYDKRFCTGKQGELEHKYYEPGKKLVQFNIRGITCGLLICHEWRYCELYREQKVKGTDILFQSWYDGNMSKRDYQTQGKELGHLITGAVKGNAANNYLWISASNTSKKESSFASFVVRPDGKIVDRLKRNVAGVLISKIDITKKYEDPSGPWRERAYRGILHSS